MAAGIVVDASSSSSSPEVVNSHSAFVSKRKRLTHPADDLQATLYEYLPVKTLCQICSDYYERPPDQLWVVVPNTVWCFNPNTYKIQRFDSTFEIQHDPIVCASFWKLDDVYDFVWFARRTTLFGARQLKYGTLEDKKLKIESKTDFHLEFVDFLFAHRNQLYFVGTSSCVWKHAEEAEEEEEEKKVEWIPELNCSWWGVSWVVCEDDLYKFGGCGEHPISARFSLCSRTWNPLPPWKSRCFSSAAFHSDSKSIFVSGGTAPSTMFDTIEIFDIKTQQFTTTHSMPKSLWDHYSFCFNNFYFLLGGFSENKENREVWKREVTKDAKFLGKWQHVATLPFHFAHQNAMFG